MTEYNLDDKIWRDRWFRSLDPDEKLVFIYCWGNPLRTPTALYYIDVRDIAEGTGVSPSRVEEILPKLAPKVEWDQTEGLLWVRKAWGRQYARYNKANERSIKGVANQLNSLPSSHPFVQQWIEEYGWLSAELKKLMTHEVVVQAKRQVAPAKKNDRKSIPIKDRMVV